MLKTLKLLLPAMIPSWNFFDVIAASPRLEYALGTSPAGGDGEWLEFRPRPEHVSLPTMARRLLWNARWNETLFLTSCAERLVDTPTSHSEDEIFKRIAADLSRRPDAASLPPWLCFRLVFLERDGDTIGRDVLFQPAPRQRTDLAAP